MLPNIPGLTAVLGLQSRSARIPPQLNTYCNVTPSQYGYITSRGLAAGPESPPMTTSDEHILGPLPITTDSYIPTQVTVDPPLTTYINIFEANTPDAPLVMLLDDQLRTLHITPRHTTATADGPH